MSDIRETGYTTSPIPEEWREPMYNSMHLGSLAYHELTLLNRVPLLEKNAPVAIIMNPNTVFLHTSWIKSIRLVEEPKPFFDTDGKLIGYSMEPGTDIISEAKPLYNEPQSGLLLETVWADHKKYEYFLEEADRVVIRKITDPRNRRNTNYAEIFTYYDCPGYGTFAGYPTSIVSIPPYAQHIGNYEKGLRTVAQYLEGMQQVILDYKTRIQDIQEKGEKRIGQLASEKDHYVRLLHHLNGFKNAAVEQLDIETAQKAAEIGGFPSIL